MAGDDQHRQPLFARSLPFVQLISSEQESVRNRIYAAVYPVLTHYHHVMLLAGGIAGIVVPVLATQGSTLINPWFLTRVAVCMGVTIFVGVLAQAYLRYAQAYFIWQLERKFQSQTSAIARAGDSEPAIRDGLASVDELHQGKLKRAEHRMSLVFWFELVFYGVFLRGIAYLIEGFIFK